MRIVRTWLGLIVGSGAMAALFVACGLDENGTAVDGSALDASGDDVRDVTPQDTYVAPTCQTI